MPSGIYAYNSETPDSISLSENAPKIMLKGQSRGGRGNYDSCHMMFINLGDSFAGEESDSLS